jgi:hypothetical protein
LNDAGKRISTFLRTIDKLINREKKLHYHAFAAHIKHGLGTAKKSPIF